MKAFSPPALAGFLAGFFAFQAALLGQQRHGAHQVLDADNSDHAPGIGVRGRRARRRATANGRNAPTTEFSSVISLNDHINCFMALANGYLWLAGLLIWPAGLSLWARAESPAAQTNFAAYARGKDQQAETRYQNNPNDAGAAWQFARACFDLADLATNRSARATVAEQGIAASRRAVAREPNLAAAHYYLGMNLGQLAQTKSLGALNWWVRWSANSAGRTLESGSTSPALTATWRCLPRCPGHRQHRQPHQGAAAFAARRGTGPAIS